MYQKAHYQSVKEGSEIILRNGIWASSDIHNCFLAHLSKVEVSLDNITNAELAFIFIEWLLTQEPERVNHTINTIVYLFLGFKLSPSSGGPCWDYNNKVDKETYNLFGCHGRLLKYSDANPVADSWDKIMALVAVLKSRNPDMNRFKNISITDSKKLILSNVIEECIIETPDIDWYIA